MKFSVTMLHITSPVLESDYANLFSIAIDKASSLREQCKDAVTNISFTPRRITLHSVLEPLGFYSDFLFTILQWAEGVYPLNNAGRSRES